VQPYAHLCHIAKTGDEMIAAIEKALTEGSQQERVARAKSMESETWQARVAAVTRTVEKFEARKHQTAHDDLIGAFPIHAAV
jgi:hypothetical protein